MLVPACGVDSPNWIYIAPSLRAVWLGAMARAQFR